MCKYFASSKARKTTFGPRSKIYFYSVLKVKVPTLNQQSSQHTLTEMPSESFDKNSTAQTNTLFKGSLCHHAVASSVSVCLEKEFRSCPE